MRINLFQKFEKNKVFSEEEAWLLFRIAAFSEAIGWTLLIIGIGIERYIIPGNHVSVLLAGRIHGMLFFIYLIAVIGLYPNLRWSRSRTFIALLASIPPYGTLFYEMISNQLRSSNDFKMFANLIFLKSILNITF